jgi:hypothetical protein
MQEPVRVYTPRTLAQRWRCSDQHVRNLIARGELKAFRARGSCFGSRLKRLRTTNAETDLHRQTKNETGEALTAASSCCDTSSRLTERCRRTTILCGGAPQGWPPWKRSTRS